MPQPARGDREKKNLETPPDFFSVLNARKFLHVLFML